ncbi:MAG: tRNA 2-selenouridine(34) synthase MnmH [Bacteroidales bacterium]|nr:tRNA 2-selenouridine(34) synthase MnmH [Bacteroidales bacterium]
MPVLEASQWLQLNDGKFPVIDVRSPLEFSNGHITGAYNMPLFDDNERKEVGTIYSHSGKYDAILRGLDVVGVKMSSFVKFARKIAVQNTVFVHCWRGGMRSEAVAWLLEFAGIKVYLLQNGYKGYRSYIRSFFEQPMNCRIIGGYTGSGKTEKLYQLQAEGQQIIDLEKLACHKGSAFGHIGETPQPTNEQFENDLYAAWSKLDLNKPVWIEDESRNLGKVVLPEPVFAKIMTSPITYLHVDIKERIDRLVKYYTEVDNLTLIDAVRKIERRIGGDRANYCCEQIAASHYSEAAMILLEYYDKQYQFSIDNRNKKS